LILPDVNVLILAHRDDQEDHEHVWSWLKREVNSERPFAIADVAVAGFIRIVTNPRIYSDPSSITDALGFVGGMMERPNCVPVSAGTRHWPIFQRVIVEANARGNLVPDAHLAAIAIEHGATIATRDRGFSRFPGLSWLDPVGR
jgi:toxin-antitoxin system PIN domain toxin